MDSNDEQELTRSHRQISWCKLEINVSDPKTVKPFSENDESAPKEMPPLTVMSLSARSIVNHQANKKEIVSTCARVWQDSRSSRLWHGEIGCGAKSDH